MPRLIDADDLLMDNTWAFYDENGNRNDACIAVENAPTVEAVPVAELPHTVWLTHDVVQVVRCKDCKWYYILNGHDRCDLLDLEARDIKPDWFCAEGERRENAN